MKGFYVLKTNGDLVYKKKAPEDDSVVKVWSFDSSSEEDRWTVVLEALPLGAKRKKVLHLTQKWGLTPFGLLKRYHFKARRDNFPSHEDCKRIARFVKDLFSVEAHFFWWALGEVLCTNQLHKCPGPEKEPGVFPGCPGTTECPVCRGTGILFRCPICFLPLRHDGTCWDKHNFPLEKVDEGGGK